MNEILRVSERKFDEYEGEFLFEISGHQRALYFSPNFEHFIIVRFWLNFRCFFLSRSLIVKFCPKLVVVTHFFLRRQRALYFSPNFEQFTIVQFWLNLRCLSLSQISIVHFCLKLVVAHHFWLRCQRALYFSPNFEHFSLLIKFALRGYSTIIYCSFLFWK